MESISDAFEKINLVDPSIRAKPNAGVAGEEPTIRRRVNSPSPGAPVSNEGPTTCPS